MNTRPAKHSSKYQPWRVLAPAGFRGSDSRKPYYFETKTAAADFCKEVNNWKRDQKRPQTDILTFEDSDKQWLAFLKRQLPDLSLLPAVLDHWTKTSEAAISPVSLRDAVARFIAHVEGEEKPSQAYLIDIKAKVNRFVAEYPGSQAHEFTRAEIKDYLSDWTVASTRNQVLKRLSKFFGWAKKERFLVIDPSQDIDFAKVEQRENIDVYSVDEITRLLNAADTSYKAIAPWVILGAFGFMRSAEICRLDWSSVDFEKGSITIAASIAKTGKRRMVEFNDALRHWLTPYRKTSGPVVQHLNGDVAKCFEAAGVKRLHNALRHSCISFAVASGMATLNQIFLWAGHTPSIALKHYIEQMTRAEAEPYWAIRREA